MEGRVSNGPAFLTFEVARPVTPPASSGATGAPGLASFPALLALRPAPVHAA